MFDKFIQHPITENFIKLFAVLFVYKMFENNFTDVKQVFDNNEYGIFIRMLFVFVLLFLLSNNLINSLLLTVFWFGLSMILNQTSNTNVHSSVEYGTVPSQYYQSYSNDIVNDNNYVADPIRQSLPNKENQINDIQLDTYFSQPGDEFPQNQTNMLELVDEFSQKPVETKNYIDSTNLLEPFCGSENCAI